MLNKKLIGLIMSIIGVVVFTFLITYFVLFKTNKIEQIESRILNKANIKLSSSRIDELISSIPYVPYVSSNYKDGYNGKKISIDTINEDILFITAYNESPLANIKKINQL